MATRTIGTSGADHADINAWVAYVQANNVTGGNLQEDVTGAVKAVGVSSTTAQTISGWAPNGFTTTLTANTGDSFKDNASVQTNALMYSTANGAFIALSSTASITVRVEKYRCKYLQIKHTGSYGEAHSINTTTIIDCIIDGNIMHVTQATTGALTLASTVDGIIIRNNLFVSERDSAGACGVDFNGACQTTPAVISDNTFWGSSNTPVKGQINGGSYGKMTVKGNVFTNVAACSINARDANVTGSNNATTKTAWAGTEFGAGTLTGLTSSQFSIVVGNEFQDADSAPTDFRLKSGGTALQNTGVSVSGVTTDIAGTSRPQGATEDIGAWEFVVAAAVASPTVPARKMRLFEGFTIKIISGKLKVLQN